MDTTSVDEIVEPVTKLIMGGWHIQYEYAGKMDN